MIDFLDHEHRLPVGVGLGLPPLHHRGRHPAPVQGSHRRQERDRVVVGFAGNPGAKQEDPCVVGPQVVRDVCLEKGAAHAVASDEDCVQWVANFPSGIFAHYRCLLNLIQ